MEIETEEGQCGTPPHSIEAEENVLGIILRDGSFLGQCIKANLEPEQFYSLKHRDIFQSMLTVAARGAAADLLGVQMILRESGKLDEVGMLDDLVDRSSTPSHGPFYLKVIQDKAKLRSLVSVCRETIDTVQSNHQPAETLLSEASFKLHQITKPTSKLEASLDVSERMASMYDKARYAGKVGLSSRWFDVQKKIVTYLPGKITLIGARPGQGKTTFGMNECIDKSLVHGIPCLVISIEMTQEEIIERAIGDLMGMDLKKFKEGRTTNEDIAQFRRGGRAIARAPLYIEHGNFTIEQICAMIREYKETKGIMLCMIDYVQLIAPTDSKRFANRNLEVSWMSQNLVHVGNETGVHLMVMSQLSRGMMAGPDKGEPELHHLRDSGSLEQDSYMTMFIFQDPNTKGEWEDNQPTMLKISKHRGGPSPARITMTFQKSMQRFVGKDFIALDIDEIEKKQKERSSHGKVVANAESESPF